MYRCPAGPQAHMRRTLGDANETSVRMRGWGGRQVGDDDAEEDEEDEDGGMGDGVADHTCQSRA
eukprot:8647687-Pyramimonas_sp.AAC.2